MLICGFNSLPNDGYLRPAFYDKSFSGKTSLPVENPYLLTFIKNKAEILAVSLSKSY